MKNCSQSEVVITGIGVTSAIGQGKADFTSALLQGCHRFRKMQREGRQKDTSFIGAEIDSLSYPEHFSKRVLRGASFTEHAALVTLDEAWNEAKLGEVDPHRIGLIIGGSNLQQRDLMLTCEKYKDNEHFITPTYGVSFMDSDLCGICTEQFGIKGMAYTVGGASASGQVAVIQAIHAVQTEQVDACVAMGALMDLSYREFLALRSLGAMGTDRYADEPEKACRPFDKDRDGFIYGEACGAVVVERADFASARKAGSYARLLGYAMAMDGNRNPNPSYEGEMRVIKKVLEQAGMTASDIDYVSPHGSGSVVGDELELKVIHDSRLSHAYMNATKSITGHGLTAAGTIEIIATLIQMKESRLHPSRNLMNPIHDCCNWVKNEPAAHIVKNAISLSFGFGGVNTAICIQNAMI
ncbi:MAG: polyketide beta-ketoacyl:ACP synthase [Clostridia bacterium]|nr:polyketide beta-ketoacyl:ACP synthase [Clostridia bacterium]